jgi:hypothetical protein
MDPDVVGFLAQVAVIVVLTASALATVAVIALRAVRTRRLPPQAQQDDRLEHLQQSVDAIAVEVERIAEAQRFSAKLLAGRPEGSAVER